MLCQKPAVVTRRSQSHSIVLPQTMLDNLIVLSRNKRVTMFMLFAAVLRVLLHAYTGKEKIGVLSATANRTRPEVQRLLGWLSNWLILPSDLSGNPSFSELLERVREVCMTAYEHADQLMVLLHADLHEGDNAQLIERQIDDLRGHRIDRDAHGIGVGEPYVFLTVEPPANANRDPQDRLQLANLAINRLFLETSGIVPGPGISFSAQEVADGLKIHVISEMYRYRPETMTEFLELYRLLLETIIADCEKPLSELVTLIQQKREDQKALQKSVAS